MTESRGSMEPVLLLGVDSPIGLTIIRELGRRGVPVHGVGFSDRALGRYSRYLKSFAVRPKGAESFPDWVKRLAHVAGARIVMAVSEGDLLALDRNREQLHELTPLVPPGGALSKVLDKEQTLALASSLGISTPISYEGASLLRANPQLLAALPYPFVLKWPDPNRIQRLLSASQIAFLKAEYCCNPAELVRALERYVPIGQYPLIQQYAPGYGLGQMILMQRGEPVLQFQHRRLHEWPPEGGVSTLCEALPVGEHAALMEKSVALLRAMGWEGPAMVEYRYDPASSQALLMEVNGRFWGSLPLASHAGAEFGWMTYSSLGLKLDTSPDPIRAGVRARYMIPETRRLWRILAERDRIRDPAFQVRPVRELLGYLSAFLDPRTRYYVFRHDDPMPCIADLWQVARKALGRS